MSIKNNIKQIQEEFKGDEKILESAFKLERLYYKYKYILFAIIAILVVWFAYHEFSSYQKDKKAIATTQIYNQLIKDPNNQALLDDLKANSKDLFDLFEYSQAMKNADTQKLKSVIDSRSGIDKNPDIIKIMADYQYSSYLKNYQGLENATNTGMKDLALLQEAHLLQQNSKTQQAQNLLNQIIHSTLPSPSLQIAVLLKHYGVSDHNSLEDTKNVLNASTISKINGDKSDKK